MAEFHHRKLLLDHTNKYASSSSSSSCYICYVCPKECYISHPPPPPPADSKSHPMAIVLILMLSVLGAAFLFLSYLTLTKYRSRRNPENALRSSSASFDEVLDHPIWYIRTVGLPRSTIDSISIVEYSCNSIMIGKSDCSVCLSEFRENEHLRLLPKCGHAFHVPCIDTWLTSHKNCPVCRAPILIGSDSGRPGPSGREAGNHDQLGDDDILTLTSKLDRINGNDGVCDSEKEEGCSDGKTETSEMGGKREDYEETVSMHSISSDGVSSTQIESRGDD